MKLVALATALCALVAAREAAAACQGRPTDAGGFQTYSYGADEVKSYSGTSVVVHYTLTGAQAVTTTSTRADGVPDTVAYAADRGDEALSKYAAMGYNAIPSDEACASNGGDGKVDIYLLKLGVADGSTFAECPGEALPNACSSFAIIDSTFTGRGYPSVDEGFSTVVTHELFHAEQNTYRANDGGFWAEGTAQWAMHQVHPELVDFVRQMPGFFQDPSRSIDSPPSGVGSTFLYGSAIWPLYLSLRFQNDVIHDIFVSESTDTDDAMTTIDKVLKTKNASLATEYPLFAAWNVGTGSLASTGGYPDAATYPGIKTQGLTDGANAISSGFGYFVYRGTLTGASNITLDTDATRNAGVAVPVENGVMQLAKAQPLPASLSGDVIVAVAGITEKKTDAPFTIHVAAAATTAPPDVDAGTSTPTSTVVTKESGGCSVPSDSGSHGNLAGVVIGLALVALRSRRKS